MTARLARDAARVLTAILMVVASTAVVVAIPGIAELTRDALGFGFAGLPKTTAEVERIAFHNAAIASAPFACAVAAPLVGARLRRLVDVVLITLLTLNAVAIGATVGAYGWRAVGALAPHALLELTAYAIAGGAYMQSCKQAVDGRCLIVAGAATAIVLATAAVLEVVASPGRST